MNDQTGDIKKVSHVSASQDYSTASRKVDGTEFIRSRVGPFLLQSLTIARRVSLFGLFSLL